MWFSFHIAFKTVVEDVGFFMDADCNGGRLWLRWGWCCTMQGPVRRIHFAPPAAEELTRGSSNMSSLGNARVSVLFANGTFGIWELDARNDLKPVLSRFPPGLGHSSS